MQVIHWAVYEPCGRVQRLGWVCPDALGGPVATRGPDRRRKSE